MEEKYGIELELITNKFKSKIKETINSIKGLGKLSKQNITLENDYSSVDEIVDKYRNLSKEMKEKVAIDMGLSNAKLADTTLQQLSDNINGIKESLKQLNLYPVLNKEEIARATAELNDATATVNMFEDSINKLNNKEISPKINNKSVSMFEKFKKNIQTGWDEAISKVKRFGLSLVGIQSIWRLVSRASSAYLSQDIELANKLQSAWVGLGAMLAPILEWISNIVIKAVSYLNVFLKALFGIDLLARATTKSIKAMGDSAKATSKTLAGFDEITNIGDNGVGSLAGGIENPFSNFGDVKLNEEIVEFLENLAEKIKPVVAWFKEMNFSIEDIGIALGTVFGASAIGKLVSNIATLIGVSGGTAGIYGIITAMTLITGVEIVILTEKIKEATEATKDWNDATSSFIDIAIDGLEKGYKWLLENSAKLSEIHRKQQQGIDLTDEENELLRQEKNIQDNIKTNHDSIAKKIQNGTTLTEEQKQKLQEILDKYGEIRSVNIDKDQTITVILEESKQNENFFSRLQKKIKNAFNQTFKYSLFGQNMELNTGGIVKYDVGTNYIPNDQLAMVHKGEAVVPKKYNPALGFGTGDNTEIIDAIYMLNDTLENKNMNAYISEKEVGKASVRYINNESRIMGESVLNI